MREGDVRSPVSLARGSDVDVERMEWEWGARRGRETTEKRTQWYEKGECGLWKREKVRAPKVFRKEGEMRIPLEEGIRKERREWKERVRKRERAAKETKEKETGIDSVPWYEARGNDMRRRTASTRSNWRGRGCTNVVVAA